MSQIAGRLKNKCLERPTGVKEVMGSNPVGNSDVFLSHSRGNISSIAITTLES